MNGKELINTISVLADVQESSFETVKNALEATMANIISKENPEYDSVSVAITKEGNLNVDYYSDGSVVKNDPSYKNFTRNTFLKAKSQFQQNFKKMQKDFVHETQSDLFGKAYNLKVTSVNKRGFIVNFDGGKEGFLPRANIADGQYYKVGFSLKAMLTKDERYRNHKYVFTRQGPEFVRSVIISEVEECRDEVLFIPSVVLEGGKATVYADSNDRNLDPRHSIMGYKGTRSSNIKKNTGISEIEVKEWDENPANRIVEYFGEGNVEEIFIDDEKREVSVKFSPENTPDLGLVRMILTSEYTLIERDDEFDSETLKQIEEIYVQGIGLDEDSATHLMEIGIYDFDMIVEGSFDKVLAENFGEESVDVIKDAVNEYFVERIGSNEKEIFSLKESGLGTIAAANLHAEGIKTIEDLSDLSSIELSEIAKVEFKDKCDSVILGAREKVGLIQVEA